MIIEASLGFDGDPEAVWERVSDVRRIPDYWHGTKSLQVVKEVEGKKVIASTKFAFGGSGKVEISTDVGSRTLLLTYLSGPFTGTQTVRVVGQRLEVRWEIEFRGIFRIASWRTAEHFRSGTVHALVRLRDGAEPRVPQQQTQP